MRKKQHVLEEYLVLQTQAGQRAAVRKLVDLRGPKLLAHATRLLGNTQDARDVVQEGWIEILRGLKDLREPRAFASWATRIITRRCARFVKGQINRRELGEALWAQGQIMPENMPYQDASEHRMVRAAIAALPAAQSATIALFYLEEMSLTEVATALDIPLGTVKTRLMHARDTLRHALKGMNDD